MSKRMLIVDDSATSRLMIKTYALKARPEWELAEADGAVAAMEELFRSPADFASIDFAMPGR